MLDHALVNRISTPEQPFPNSTWKMRCDECGGITTRPICGICYAVRFGMTDEQVQLALEAARQHNFWGSHRLETIREEIQVKRDDD